GQPTVTNGSAVSKLPRSSVLTQGFAVGSDSMGVSQVKGLMDELETFDYQLPAIVVASNYQSTIQLDTDHDGITDIVENEIGTDPNNPDTDGDGLSDGYELQFGLNPLVADDPTADSDYDGRNTLQEQGDWTDPFNPNSVLNVRLAYWKFDN